MMMVSLMDCIHCGATVADSPYLCVIVASASGATSRAVPCSPGAEDDGISRQMLASIEYSILSSMIFIPNCIYIYIFL